MPKGPRVDFDVLANKLKAHLANGVSNVTDACRYLGVSQSTFSRLITRLPGDFLIIGRASQTRYALRREIPDVESTVEVHKIDEKGRAAKVGVLNPIFYKGFFFKYLGGSGERIFEDLPYFMDDLRPSGFLGRLIPKRHSELGLPKDINFWTANDCLKYLTRFGHDLIGNIIVGDKAFQRYLDANSGEPVLITPSERLREYPKRAIDVLEFGDPGSSAGGEQPKFSSMIGPKPTPVLVKFSPKIENKVSQRRADLLVCEHICLETMRAHGHLAAESNLIQTDRQVFLEIKRFDRVGRLGRRGLISLRALDAEFVGKNGHSWIEISEELLKQGIINRETFLQVRWREIFGHLTGNTDMHSANISFYFDFPDVHGLAPAYDMLPMLYAPQNDEVINREFKLFSPRPSDSEVWSSAWEAGCGFWTTVSKDARVSSGFRKIANENLKRLASRKDVQKLLPK